MKLYSAYYDDTYREHTSNELKKEIGAKISSMVIGGKLIIKIKRLG